MCIFLLSCVRIALYIIIVNFLKNVQCVQTCHIPNPSTSCPLLLRAMSTVVPLRSRGPSPCFTTSPWGPLPTTRTLRVWPPSAKLSRALEHAAISGPKRKDSLKRNLHKLHRVPLANGKEVSPGPSENELMKIYKSASEVCLWRSTTWPSTEVLTLGQPNIIYSQTSFPFLVFFGHWTEPMFWTHFPKS